MNARYNKTGSTSIEAAPLFDTIVNIAVDARSHTYDQEMPMVSNQTGKGRSI
jgi:hypothetical protein